MRKFLLASAVVLCLVICVSSPEARKPKPPLRPVLTPIATGGSFVVQGSAVAYQTEQIMALFIPLLPDEEETFFEKHAGKRMRLFSKADGKSPFIVFRLTLENKSQLVLGFNPSQVSFKSRKGHYAMAKGYAELYSRYQVLPDFADIRKIFEKKLWDGTQRIRPGEKQTKLLVLPMVLTKYDKKAVLDCSFIYIGPESFHLEIPYLIEWEELREGQWVKKGKK